MTAEQFERIIGQVPSERCKEFLSLLLEAMQYDDIVEAILKSMDEDMLEDLKIDLGKKHG